MQALLNLTNAGNTLSRLHSFYDTVENQIRGLSPFGKSPESYDDLLTPIIFANCQRTFRRVWLEAITIQNGHLMNHKTVS